MRATLIDGKTVAAQIREEVRLEVERISRSDQKPALAVILVGDDPASQVYVRNKARACEKAGIHSITQTFPAEISEQQLLNEIQKFNDSPEWHGILVQLPLPAHINAERVIEAIRPEKDVDCFHPFNVGRLMLGMPVFLPATPAGIVELLHRYQIETSGKHVVILGRSNIVGKPLANLLMQKDPRANAIVTVVHSAAGDVTSYTREADILIAAIGKAEFVRKEMVKEGAVVIDVGINRVEADTPRGYRLVGDVAFDEVAEVADYITPVPGGVGPMTIAMLLKNTLKAYEIQS
ncbi:MAG: bifunctional methylenetetrahydrofolate dehydrogenase/methenyltetrahydrofolate cyclohydrolase FolD [Calditrichaeota bacterium]|nr:MAG: bifunctional methylenetetrahydrofolate dehydrogenase/methenyltetrahydrofolate cyclohydrolase FolD [Calditrichota bacterium]